MGEGEEGEVDGRRGGMEVMVLRKFGGRRREGGGRSRVEGGGAEMMMWMYLSARPRVDLSPPTTFRQWAEKGITKEGPKGEGAGKEG